MTENRNSRKSVWYFIRQYRFRSLLFRNFILIILVIIFPLLFVVRMGYSRLTNETNLRLMDMNRQLLQKSVAVTENIMEGIVNLLTEVSAHPAVSLVLESSLEQASFMSDADSMFRTVSEYTAGNGFVQGVYLYSDINELLFDGKEEKCQTAWRSSNKQKWYYIYQKFELRNMFVLRDEDNSLLFCNPLFTQDGRALGMVVFDVHLQGLNTMLERDGLIPSGYFFITGVDGQIMYCNREEYFHLNETERRRLQNELMHTELGTTVLNAGRPQMLLSTLGSDYKNWRYAYITEISSYQQETEMLNSFLLTSGLVSIAMATFAAYVITWVTYRPVKKIVDVIDEPHDYRLPENGNREADELIYITSNILNTLSTQRGSDQELQQRMKDLRQAQALALQRQIDPHFLYNTLETIKWTTVEEFGRGNKPGRLIGTAARLYRICLEGNEVLVPLRQELEFLTLYADLLNARFGGTVRFEWDIDPNLMDCSVIKLSVQPLVENAVNHGLMPCDYDGAIRIAASRSGESFFITVDNDGSEISAERIQELNRKLQERDDFGGHKVGLRNVNERIKLIFGELYGVELSRVRAGNKNITRTTITLPYVPSETERRT